MNKNNFANERETLLLKFMSNSLLLEKLTSTFFNYHDSSDEESFYIFHDLQTSLSNENNELMKQMLNDNLICTELNYRLNNFVVEKLKDGHIHLSPGCTSFTPPSSIEWSKTYRKTAIDSLLGVLLFNKKKEREKKKDDLKSRRFFKVIK